MRAHGDDRHRSHPRFLRDFRKKRAANAARGLDRREQMLRQVERADDILRPVARHRINELAGGGYGIFRAQLARKQIHQ